ncbi:MAG TPA: helix-turn-helix domain-containing protein [Trebonia sp.]|nr:helix-turn-helix domain-containing protein [Trebonia sp.]
MNGNRGTAPPKYVQAAAIVRAQIEDGTLKPGQAAPSGAHLARLTGFSELTCRKALRTLVTAGVLVPGLSVNARPRVAVQGGTGAPGPRAAEAARALSGALGALRRAAGLTQPQLARVTGFSVTTVGHAETGRLWQSRQFWEKTDMALSAGGRLTRLHDAYRSTVAAPAEAPQPNGEPASVAVAPATVIVVWGDGTVTTVKPPTDPSL